MKLILLIIGLVLIIGTVSAATPPTVYVDTDGSGDYDCDGTDDHVQINQALAFVGSNAGYYTVHLNGSNTYWINATLDMYSNTTLQGDTDAEIKLAANASLGYLIPLIGNETSGSINFTIKDFTIDGNSENQSVSRGTGYHTMMYFKNCYNITVTDMRLEWGSCDGLKVEHTSGAQDSAYVTFTNNSVYKLGHDVLYALRLNNVTAANNDVFTRTNSAFRLAGSNTAEIYNNTIHSEFAGWSTGPGIEIDSGYTIDNIEIYNNTIYNLNGAGIWLRGNSAAVGTDIHIHHNIFYDVGQYWSYSGYSNAAITIGQFNNTIIENNVIDDGGHAGVKHYIYGSVVAGTFTTTIRNNIIINTDGQTTSPAGSGAGIWNYNDTNHNFLSDNNCIYNNTESYNGTNITYSDDIYVDPLFYNESNHEYYLNSTIGTWNSTDWEVMTTYSPCIDSGKPTSDYSEEPTPNGGIINIGVYGGTIYASKSTLVTTFISPTLANDSTTSDNYVEVNASINTNNLTEFMWNWNGTNYSQYNSSRVLHMSFDNRSGIGDSSTVVVDVSSQGNNGSFINGTTGNWTTLGDWNGAMLLDGDDDNISSPMINISGAHTLSIRMYPIENNLEYQGVFGSGQISDSKSRYLFYYRDQKIHYEVCNGTDIHTAYYLLPNLNSWYHIVGTWDGTNNSNGIKLYVNKVRRSQRTATFNTIDTYKDWYIGRDTHGTDRHFAGIVDEARVDLYVWDQEQINQSYDSNLYKYNNTYWYFWSNQTGLAAGEYNYQIFANNVESDYRVVTFGQMYNISGIISDNNGDTLAVVTVSDNESVDSNVSYGAGIYNLTGYLNDTYNLTLSKSGFDTGYLEVTISGADNTTANKQIFDNTPPGQVTGLTEDSKNQTTVNISWVVVSSADSYQIFRNDSSQGYTTNLYYNDTGLTENTNYGYEVRANDSYNNWGVNSSELVVTTDGATPIVTLLSQTPSTICQNCTGNISIEYGISHSSAGLNNTSISFIYRDYDHDLSDSNHSIRPPINNLASEWNFDGSILRGANRNESLNFENNATITGGDTYSWSGLDENKSEMSIVPINSSYTKVYINSTIHRVMPQMHYIDRSELQEAPKTTIAIHKNQDVLVKFWNFEIFKGNTDFLGVGYTDTTLDTNPALHPSDANPVNYHYISSGYDPSAGSDPLTSGYAVYMGSLNATGWTDHVYSPHANSSYTRGFINNTLLHSYINTTNISYVLYTSNTPSNKGYLINVTDVATSSNVSFANTSVLWAGDNAMSAEPYTPNIWFAFMKDNVSFDHKLYVADNNDLWGNSTINSTTIGEALFPPTKPSFYSFHNGDTDYDMNGTYSGTFNVQISAGSDPDGGDVVHNVSIHYGNGTYIESIFNTSCNASCLYMNVSFDSTPYYSGTENYTFKVVATDDEGECVTTWLGVNFSLGLHVSGTVYGGDNIGLSDVSMTLGTYSTTTASDGTFLFTGISDGSHTLTSYIDGYDTLSKTVIVSGADVTGQDFYYDIIVDRGGGGGSGGFISIVKVLDEEGEVIGKAIAIGKPGEAWFTIDLVCISQLLSAIDPKNTWTFIAILSSISILAGLFDTSKTTRPELLLVLGFVGMGFYAIYQSKLAIVIGFG